MTASAAISSSKDKNVDSSSVSAPVKAVAVRRPRPGSVVVPAPLAPPPFTKESLRRAIPAICFERNVFLSLGYMLRDVTMLASLALAASHIDHHALVPVLLRPFAWAAYWYAAGCVGTGLWMIGHECGHGAFSDYGVVNYVVGSLAHTFCGVPYSAWRITHARHHKYTNSMEDDEPFVPMDFGDVIKNGLLANSDVLSIFFIVCHLLFGWPLYLLVDLGGPVKNVRPWSSRDHFTPWSVQFEPAQRLEILVGTALYLSWIAALYQWAVATSFLRVVAFYGIPLLIVNAHLITITYLQHTDASVPHYRGAEFNWLRGALATVDRSWSRPLDILFHHISNTHVAHHLFHDMPFYRAEQATEALKVVLGDYYLKDDTPIAAALWRSFKYCKFVGDEDVAVWNTPADLALRRNSMKATTPVENGKKNKRA